VKDPGIEAYVEAIEAHLRSRRGVDHVLSPRDFALARAWHNAGVPLATVLVGIDLAFESGGGGTSLAFCRRRVEELLACGRRPERRPSPPAETVPLQEVEALLASLVEQLAALRPGPHACFEPPLRKIEEMRGLVAVAVRPNWSYVRGKLREIDDDVSAAAVQALGADALRAVEDEARRAVERHRSRMDAEALADAVSRFTVHRARERLGLPRVSIV
jgi:Arc/MetJ family transcription regulator